MSGEREAELLSLVEETAKAERRINELAMKGIKLSEKLVLMRARYTREVWQEKDENGKPRYPNERLREAELTLRLNDDKEYRSLRAEYDSLRQEEGEQAAEHNRLIQRRQVLMGFPPSDQDMYPTAL